MEKLDPPKKGKFKQKTFHFMSKILSTQFLQKLYKKFNFPVTILRLYLVYGPYQIIIE